METRMSRRHTVKKATPKIANGSKLLSGSSAYTMQAVRAKVTKTCKQENKFNIITIRQYIILYSAHRHNEKNTLFYFVLPYLQMLTHSKLNICYLPISTPLKQIGVQNLKIKFNVL
jgi:hypothetical protein